MLNELMLNSQFNSNLYDNSQYSLVETKNGLKLVETYIDYEFEVGEVRTWRKELLLTIEKTLEKDNRERGYKFFLILKILNKMKKPDKAHLLIKTMRKLTLEETIFWVWQFHSYGNKAINAFNQIHLY